MSNEDLTNKTFGNLQILKIEKIYKNNKYKTYAYCLCKCGNNKLFRLTDIVRGKKVSCGCIWKQKISNICTKRNKELSEEEKDRRKSKTKQTSIERYGKNHYTQTEEFKQKRKETNIKKYGVEYPIQSPIISDKIRSTNLIKYGYNSPLESSIVRNKIKNTNIDKYNTEYPSQNQDVKDKIKRQAIESGRWYEFDNKTTQDIAEEKGIAKSTLIKWIKNYGLEEAIKMQKNCSSIEQKIAFILDKNNIKYTQHKRVGKYFPDFIVNNVIIECDGLYWHSDAVIQDRFYHAKKREFYISVGYRPLFFREDEIYHKINIIESIILNKLGLNQKIYARKCSIVEGAREFFTNNHLMGSGRGKIIALTHNNVVVAALQYFKRNNITEIDRFCTLPNISVVGGFSKLVSKLETPISTFIDLRYGSGEYLTTLDFSLDTNYLSFRWCYSNKSYHRCKFKNNTGYEYNYNKIWDCGQAKYIKL